MSAQGLIWSSVGRAILHLIDSEVAKELPQAIPQAGDKECVMGLNLNQAQPPEGAQGSSNTGGSAEGTSNANGGVSGMVDKIVDKVKSALGGGDAGEGQQTLAGADAGEEGLVFGRKPFIGAPVLYTHPDGQKVHAAFICGIREHGGCDLYVLAPGDAYWERNISQGEGPNRWRENTGDQQ